MTPYSSILDSFHSSFQSRVVIPDGLVDQFFYTAVGDFELEIFELLIIKEDIEVEIESEIEGEPNTFITQNIIVGVEILDSDKQLNRSQINLLGKLMYKAYLSRERDRVLKLNNIVGRDIRLTGMADTKYAFNRAYLELLGEITELTNKLKENTFSD